MERYSWTEGYALIGIFDPFGIADGINTLIYPGKGDLKNAAISAIGILPFGDIDKRAKYLDEAAEVVKAVVKYADEVEEIAVKNLDEVTGEVYEFKHYDDFGDIKVDSLKISVRDFHNMKKRVGFQWRNRYDTKSLYQLHLF